MSIRAVIAFQQPLPLSETETPFRCPCVTTSIRAIPSRARRFIALVKRGDGDRAGEDEKEDKTKGKTAQAPVGNGDLKKALGMGFRWRDLLDPDPENIVAVGLTGLLALASVQALWQLFFISVAILLAALKYSFIAALLLFLVITLL